MSTGATGSDDPRTPDDIDMTDPAATVPHRGDPERPRSSALPLAGILALALALRLPGYTESVWIDELFTSNLFCGDTVILLKTLYSDIHPPLYFVFIHFWNAAFGDAEVFLRLPPLLCGLGSILLVYRLAEMFAGRTAGLVAAIAMAVSPVHIWYSQEARPYSAIIFLVLLSTVAFYRLLEGRRHRGWALLYFAALFGAVFTHYYIAVFPFAFSLFAILAKSPNRARILWVNGIVLALLAVYMGAKMYFSEVPTSKGYLRTFDAGEAWDLAFVWFLTGNSFTPRGVDSGLGTMLLSIVQVVGVAAFGRGVYRLCARPRTGWPGYQLVLAMLAVPAFLFLLPFLGMEQTYIERSALPALPFFLVIVAVGLTGVQRPVLARLSLGVAGLAAAGVLVAFFANRGLWTVYKPNPDWRSAARWLAEDIEGTEGRHTMYSTYASPTGLTYYDPRFRELKHFERNDDKLQKLRSLIDKVFGTSGFPGDWIRSVVDERFEEFERKMAEAARDTRVGIQELGAEHHPLDADPGGSPEDEEFYFLVHGNPDARERAFLEDPRLRVIRSASFLWVHVYRMARVPPR